MATVTVVSRGRNVDMSAGERRRGYMTVTGGTIGTATPNANSFEHDLGFAPSIVIPVPGVSGLWTLTQAADSTNVYVTIASGGSSLGTIVYEE